MLLFLLLYNSKLSKAQCLFPIVCFNIQEVYTVNTQFTQVFRTIHRLKNYHFPVYKLYPAHLGYVMETMCALCVRCIKNL
jgi:hypothetical protein